MRRGHGRACAMGAAWAVAAVTMIGTIGPAGPAAATSVARPDGAGWVVTVGDSAISGEAGRWAGNTNQSSWRHDTGADAYFDNASNSAETTPGCHRSKAAEVHIGGGVKSLNLACSGARTYTQTGSDFKPGLDWYNGPAGKSQVVQLQEFAAANDVDAVTILIGANNFGFADIVQQCVTNWLTSPSWWKNYCNDDSSVRNRFTASAVDARTNEVAGAIANVAQAMTNAGYASTDYKVIIQTYWSPVPTRQSDSILGEWMDAADHRRMRDVEPRRGLGQRHRGRQDEPGPHQWCRPEWHRQLRRAGHVAGRSTGTDCARRASVCSREVGLSTWTQPARPTARSG